MTEVLPVFPVYPLEVQFASFAKYMDAKADGKTITIQQLDRWFVQAEIIDFKTVTYTDTGISFNKFKRLSLDYKTFLLLLLEFCERKNLDVKEVKDKLKACGSPGFDKNKRNSGNANAANTEKTETTEVKEA